MLAGHHATVSLSEKKFCSEIHRPQSNEKSAGFLKSNLILVRSHASARIDFTVVPVDSDFTRKRPVCHRIAVLREVTRRLRTARCRGSPELLSTSAASSLPHLPLNARRAFAASVSIARRGMRPIARSAGQLLHAPTVVSE